MSDKKPDFINHFPYLTAIRPVDIIKKLEYSSDTQFHRHRKRFKLRENTVLTEQMGNHGAKYTAKVASKFVDEVREFRKTGKTEKANFAQISNEMESLRESMTKRLQKLSERLALKDNEDSFTSQKLLQLEDVPERIKQQGEHYTHLLAKQQEQIESQALIIEQLTSAVENNNTQLQNLKTFITNQGTTLQTEPAQIGAVQQAETARQPLPATPIKPVQKPTDFIKC